MDKNIYYSSEPITTIDEGGPVIIFSLDNGSQVGGAYSYTPGWTLDDNGLMSRGEYSIVEFTTLDMPCFYGGLSYDECTQGPEYVNEFKFTITAAPSGTGGGSDELPPVLGPNTIAPTTPQVSISSFKAGSIFSNSIPVVYTTTDGDDTGDEQRKMLNGLLDFPVSIFYTDTFTQISDVTTDTSNKTLIAKGLPPSGTYHWDISSLLESKFYHIIVRAIDKAGEIGQAVSEFFSVDFTKPTFIVTPSVTVVKNEDVILTVVSSEELSEVPVVTVEQRGMKQVPVVMNQVLGIANTYTGTYHVVNGFDGTAHVNVTGSDVAGNIGTVIIGGGTFSVGINPPAKPTILSPNNNDVVTTSTITVSGAGRDDTQIILTVNGTDMYTTVPNDMGEFTIKNVSLLQNIHNGKNTLNIVSKDKMGSVSEALVIPVYFNAVPVISFVQPEQNILLSGSTLLQIHASDLNNDALRFQYEIAQKNVSLNAPLAWKNIANTPYDTLYLDTTKFLDGDYYIRCIADDGMSFVPTNPYPIRIKNEASFYIRFFDGLRPVVRQNSAIIRGVVYAEKNVFPQPIIKNIEYTMNAGKSWVKVTPRDGYFDSPEERFEVFIKNLKNGVNNVTWRTTDSRGRIVTSDEPITLDTIEPAKPDIIFPKSGILLTSNDNQTYEKNQFVFTVRGTGEPDTIVTVEIDGEKYSGRVSFDGTFRVEGIRLSKHGSYTMKVQSVDEASNMSPIVEYPVVYNNPPTVTFVNPNSKGLTTTNALSWITYDKDFDHVSNVTLSYHQIGTPLVLLAKNIQENLYTWDTTKIKEGSNYELVLTVSDGISSTTEHAYFSIDRTAPNAPVFTVKNSELSQGQMLTVEGSASDTGSGILFVEYRYIPIVENTVFSETPWYKATLHKTTYTNTQFVVHEPVTLSDGRYTLVVRSVDAAHNVSKEVSKDIIVDTTSPRIGSFDIVSNGVRITPHNTIWDVGIDTHNTITVSLESDTNNAYLVFAGKNIILEKDKATGLWVGELIPREYGDIPLQIVAKDSKGNSTPIENLSVLRIVNTNYTEVHTPKISWWRTLLRMLQFK